MAHNNNNILLTYKGVLSFDIIEDILSQSKEKMDAMDLELVVKKRVYSVLVECLENTYKHNTFSKDNLKHAQVELIVEKTCNNFIVNISNYINNENLKELTSKIDTVNNLDLTGLNQLYRTSISKARISEKGGAGLGIIEIARNSRQRINYQINPENENDMHFNMQVNISDTVKKTC